MIALSHAGSEVAEQVMTRMRAALAALALGPGGERVTISAGIAEFPRHAQDSAALLRLADGAMYWAKRAGRDGWTVYNPHLEAALTPIEEAERARDDATRARHDAGQRVRDDTLAATIHALTKAVDARDPHTHLHSQRVASYAAVLAAGLGLDAARVNRVRTAGVLHDVGKIGIPDAVLLKPGALEPDEFEEMRRHSVLGRDIVAGAGMPEIAEWVGALHERVDGTGTTGRPLRRGDSARESHPPRRRRARGHDQLARLPERARRRRGARPARGRARLPVRPGGRGPPAGPRPLG